ncbi:MAG: hypothetical protein ACMV0K_05595 [Sulfurospirillum sp.]|jgi:predicted site-specific integrase-resolvase
MENDLMTRKALATKLGVHYITIGNWMKEGKIIPEKKEPGHRQVFSYRKVMTALGKEIKETYSLIFISDVMYDQKQNIEEEQRLSKQFCVCKGWQYRVVIHAPFELGSTNDDGVKELVREVLNGSVERVIIPSKSKLGFSEFFWIKSLCEEKSIPFVVIGVDVNETIGQSTYALLMAKHLVDPKTFEGLIHEIL